MHLHGNTILITGGSEGVGLALAGALCVTNTVIICGRDAGKLARAKAAHPALLTEVCDVRDAWQREALAARVLSAHPSLNVLVNNAGGRTRADLRGGTGAATALQQDLALNFEAPALLCTAFVAHLRAQPRAAIVNVTTGLALLPKAEQPFYCAAKAALHSFTTSLRWSLRGSTVEVFEMLLPLVDTAFHGGTLPTTIAALSADEAAHRMLRAMACGRHEAHIGKAWAAKWLARFAPRLGLRILNAQPA